MFELAAQQPGFKPESSSKLTILKPIAGETKYQGMKILFMPNKQGGGSCIPDYLHQKDPDVKEHLRKQWASRNDSTNQEQSIAQMLRDDDFDASDREMYNALEVDDGDAFYEEMSADDLAEFDPSEDGIYQAFSSEEEPESSEQPEIATAMQFLFVVPPNEQPKIINTLEKVTSQNPRVSDSSGIFSSLFRQANSSISEGNVTIEYLAEKQWKISSNGRQYLYLYLNTSGLLEVHNAPESSPISSPTSSPKTTSPTSSTTTTTNQNSGTVTGSPLGRPRATNIPWQPPIQLPPTTTTTTTITSPTTYTTITPTTTTTTTATTAISQKGKITSERAIPSLVRKSYAKYARHKSSSELKARFKEWKRGGWTCWVYHINPSKGFALPLGKGNQIKGKTFDSENYQKALSKTSEGFISKNFTGCFANDWGLTIYWYKEGDHYKGQPDSQLAQDVFLICPWLQKLLKTIWPELSKIVSQRGYHGITFQGYYYGDKATRVIAVGLSPDCTQFEILVDSGKKHGYLWQFKQNEELRKEESFDDDETDDLVPEGKDDYDSSN